MRRLLFLFLIIVGSVTVTAERVTAQDPCDYYYRLGVIGGALQEYWQQEDGCGGLPTVEPAITVAPLPVITDTPTLTPTLTRTPTATRTAAPPPIVHTYPPTATAQSTPTPNAAAQIRIVPDQYPSIGAALAGIPNGSTVRLRSGTYSEIVIVAVSGVTIEAFGDGPAAPIVDGGCIRDVAVHIRADDVTVRGLELRNTRIQGVLIGGEGNPAGSPSRARVEGNYIHDWNCTETYQWMGPNANQFTGQAVGAQYFAGVAAWYGGPGHQVVGNRIHLRPGRTTLGGQMGLGNGIWFKSANDRPSGGGHTITDNIIIGGYDGIGGETEDDERGSFDRDTLIARNTVSECFDDGIQTEGGNVNVRVEDNIIHQCSVGIALAPNLVGPLFVERNRIIGTQTWRGTGIGDILACMKLGNYGNGFAYLTENVCYIRGLADGTGDTGDGLKQTNTGLQGFVTRDNIIDVSRYVIEFKALPLTGSYLDDLCLWTTDSVRFINVGGRLDSLATFRAAALNLGLNWEARAVQQPCGVEVP